MFASLKNKIKEETGSNVTTPGVIGPHQRISNNNRMRSRFSSTMSVNSTSDEFAGETQNHMHDQLSMLRSQCNDYTTKVSDLMGRLQTLQEEKIRVEKTNEILLETVKVAQTQKDIYCEEQEKIQNLQQAEIVKLKSLLSFREQEAVDRLAALRQQQQQIENLTGELERLKQIEPMVEDLQDSLESDNKDLQARLQAADERFTDYATNSEQVGETLRQQNAHLLEQLSEAQNKLELECEEKLTALLRNAEISQSEEVLKKELRVERDEANELHERNQQLLNQVQAKELEVSTFNVAINELKTAIATNEEKLHSLDEMQLELNEKNKAIKVLNQRLADIKKTLQKEFRSTKSFDDGGTTPPTLDNVEKTFDNGYVSAPIMLLGTNNAISNYTTSSNFAVDSTNPSGGLVMDEVNFKYLKHVIVKFLTSREVEARHLIRAVATLLKLTKEEEKLLHDTLNWKMSWFGSKPDHGSGQRAFSIPPS